MKFYSCAEHTDSIRVVTLITTVSLPTLVFDRIIWQFGHTHIVIALFINTNTCN